jgi:hypothetical protein
VFDLKALLFVSDHRSTNIDFLSDLWEIFNENCMISREKQCLWSSW